MNFSINFHLKLMKLLVLESLLKNCISDDTVIQILSFSRILSSFHVNLTLQISITKVFTKSESLTIQCDLYHPFREHWSKFIKRTNRKPRSRYNKVWTILLFQEFYVSFHWKILFATLNILKSFSQVQCELIHSVNLVRFDQFLSKVRLVWSTLSFVASGQETILKMREKKNLSICSFFWRVL